MGKKIIKYLSLILLSLLAMIIVCLTACSNALMETVPFNLNTLLENFDPPRITFIKSSEEFDEFLSDKTIFIDDFEQEFIDVNAKYNDEFFDNNDLIALILQATSRMVKGYKLNEISISDNSWILDISSVAENSSVTSDMGGYFCYYISVDKNPEINEVKIK